MKKILALLALLTVTGCGTHVHRATHADTTESEDESRCYVVETFDRPWHGLGSKDGTYNADTYCREE